MFVTVQLYSCIVLSSEASMANMRQVVLEKY